MASITEVKGDASIGEKYAASQEKMEEVVVRNMFTNAAAATGQCCHTHKITFGLR